MYLACQLLSVRYPSIDLVKKRFLNVTIIVMRFGWVLSSFQLWNNHLLLHTTQMQSTVAWDDPAPPALGVYPHNSVGSSPHLTPQPTPSHYHMFRQIPALNRSRAHIRTNPTSLQICSLHFAMLYHFGPANPETPRAQLSHTSAGMTLNPQFGRKPASQHLSHSDGL